jgi:two-component system, OmpR family, sensor kinase
MRITGRIARQPLWLKLMVTVACLTSAGLAVLAVAVVVVVRGYLMGQVDQQVRRDAQRLMSSPPPGPQHSLPASAYPDSLLPGAPPGSAHGFEVLDPAGRRIGPAGQVGAGLDLQLSPAWITAHLGSLMTLPSQHGGQSWRVILEPVRYQARHQLFVYGADYSVSASKQAAGVPGTLAVGVELGGVNRSTGRLAAIEAVAGAAFVVLVAGLTALAARASMRRLTGICTLPPQATDGDLSYRFPVHNDKTEAGRVMRALNDMLGQAQKSLAERAAAEQATHASAAELGQRLASMVKELRGPVSIIAGFAGYYLERSPLGPQEFDDMMKRIGDEAASMAQTMDKLAPDSPPDRSSPQADEPTCLRRW